MTLPKLALDERVDRYLKSVWEIKLRLNEMQIIRQNWHADFPRDFSKVELMHLHVRKICEFLALGCASLHSMQSPIGRRDDSKRYRADHIFNLVSEWHYPRAIILGVEGILTKSPQPMPQAELLRHYNFADNILHAGNIRDVFAGHDKKITFLSSSEFADALSDHLHVHTVHLETERKMLMVSMMAGQDFPTSSFWAVN